MGRWHVPDPRIFPGGLLVRRQQHVWQAQQVWRCSKLRKAEQELSVANAALSAALSAKDQELARLRGIGVEDLEERELKELQATLQEGQRRVNDALLRPEAEQRVVQEHNSFVCPIGLRLLRCLSTGERPGVCAPVRCRRSADAFYLMQPRPLPRSRRSACLRATRALAFQWPRRC